jgi:hypothetical protein
MVTSIRNYIGPRRQNLFLLEPSVFQDKGRVTINITALQDFPASSVTPRGTRDTISQKGLPSLSFTGYHHPVANVFGSQNSKARATCVT